MTTCSSNNAIIKRLINAGIVPPLCTRFSLICNVDEPVRMEFDCLVSEEQLQEVVDALISNPAEASQIARTVFLKSRESDRTQNVNL